MQYLNLVTCLASYSVESTHSLHMLSTHIVIKLHKNARRSPCGNHTITCMGVISSAL